jgi:hypothetical protein
MNGELPVEKIVHFSILIADWAYDKKIRFLEK